MEHSLRYYCIAIPMVSTSLLEAKTSTVFVSGSVILDWGTFTEVKFEVLLKNWSRSNQK